MDGLIRYRKPLLWGLILITIGGIVGVFQLKIDFSFDSFYPKEDPEYQYYLNFQEQFAAEQNFMIMVGLQSPTEDVFDQAFLQYADSLFDQMKSLSGLDSMISATEFVEIRRTPLSVNLRPWLEFNSPEQVERSKRRVEKDTSIVGIFITRDRKYLCSYLFITPELFDAAERDVLNAQLDEIVEQSGLEYIITGIPYIRTEYTKKLTFELLLFTGLSIVFIILVLTIMYRNFWGVVVPFLAVMTSLIWIVGLMGWSDEYINLINNLLIPIIFVVGMSDVIHLVTKYLHEINGGNTVPIAIKHTLKEIGLATFLTSLTTAIGFASLMVSRIPPMKSFGMYAAIGVLFTYVVSIIIIPNALLKIPPAKLLGTNALENKEFWSRWLLRVYLFTTRKSREILVVSFLIIGSCVYLITQISLDMYLLEDVKPSDPIRKSLTFFEEQAYGIRPFEMGIEAKGDYKVTDYQIIEDMKKIQDFLRERESFSPFLSMATLLEQSNYLFHFNSERYRALPASQSELDEMMQFMELQGARQILQTVVSEDRKTARLSSRLPDNGTYAFRDLMGELDEFIATECHPEMYEYSVTGYTVLTENNLDYLRSSLLWGLAAAFVVIGGLMGLLFKSWKMMLISMVPNMIPLILTGGVMGLFGIKLTASTAIVFVIAFGIAVDDTIHFLTRYRLETQKGNPTDVAIRNTILGTGKAMIITSMVLMAGFIILLASNFGGTFSTGLFTSLTIVFALLADLFLLPIFLLRLNIR